MSETIIAGVRIDTETNMPVIPKGLEWEVKLIRKGGSVYRVSLIRPRRTSALHQFWLDINSLSSDKEYKVIGTDTTYESLDIKRNIFFAAMRVARQYYKDIENAKIAQNASGTYPPNRLDVDLNSLAESVSRKLLDVDTGEE